MKKDSVTLEDLKTGSDQVLGRVYSDCREPFIRFASRYGMSREDIVDAYQDAYIAFYDNVMNGKIEHFTSSITTYIISIGRHKILDRLKSKKRTVNPDFDLTLLQKKNDLVETLDLEPLVQTEEQTQFYEQFQKLGKKCKEILDLFYYRGFTISDILELGNYTSENVIKSTKSRCIKTLKDRIKYEQ